MHICILDYYRFLSALIPSVLKVPFLQLSICGFSFGLSVEVSEVVRLIMPVKMKFIFILCCIAVPAAFAEQINPLQNAEELDRARSAWNFGGHQPIKKSTYWNRPRNVAGPGSIMANRRSGAGSAPMAPHTKKFKPPGMSQRRRQNKPFSQNPAYQSRQVAKRNTSPFPFPPPQSSAYPQSYPMPYYPHQPRVSASPWNRSSRKLRTAADPIKSRFMKEELWHLDKGEGYALKEEDLDRDSLLRKRRYESQINEIEHHHHPNSVNSAVHHHHHQKQKLEKDAENVVMQAGKVVESKPGSIDYNTAQLQHVHHHHHYGAAKDATKHRTPNMMKRRRRRSADMQMPTDAKTQSFLQQIFGASSGMTPIVTRKHYSSHVGNGKNTGYPSAQQGNYKVPATIIAPPKFNKDDVLSMLMGSGGVSADAMGTVVATNNRYVRFGRGLPNGRQSRQLQWGTDSKTSPAQYSTNNQFQSVANFPNKQISPAKKPMVHLTPPPPKAHFKQAPAQPQVHPPLVLNVQINSVPSPHVKSGPVRIVPIPTQQQQHQEVTNSGIPQQPIASQDYHQQQQPIMQQEESKTTSVIQPTPSEPFKMVYVYPSAGKSKKLDPIKHNEWMPVYLKKPRKAYNYDLVNGKAETSESRFINRKVKPSAIKQEKGGERASSTKYENINDQLVEIATPTAGNYYDSFGNSLDNEENNWEDILHQPNTDTLPDSKTLSYAVRNNYRDDNILQDISSREQDSHYSNSNTAFGENDNIYFNDNLSNNERSYADENNNNSYNNEPEKYYTVKKVVADPDPIFISVPKENSFTNELYDIRK